MMGVPGSIVIAGRAMLCSLTGVSGSSSSMNTGLEGRKLSRGVCKVEGEEKRVKRGSCLWSSSLSMLLIF